MLVRRPRFVSIQVFVFIILICAISACSQGIALNGGPSKTDVGDGGASSKSIVEVTRDVRDFESVNAKDDELINLLKNKLIEALDGLNESRFSSGVPLGDAGKVTDLAYDGSSGMLTWSYMNLADYDLSGDVGVPDITPIAQNYLANAVAGEVTSWIDGDSSGDVGISDITPIANNYLNSINEYVIVTSSTTTGTFTEIGRATLDEAKAALPIGVTFPIVFHISLPAGAQQFIAVQPVDGNEILGEMSDAFDWQAASGVTCLGCHSSKDMLIATAEPPDPIEEPSGES